jgi:glucan phosphoethanolaminetransferase (alkaline phosphatase superfamily)
MSHSRLRWVVALGSVAILLLVEFCLFQDFFYPFRHLWNHGRIFELFVSLFLFLWSLLGAFLILFSGRSLVRTLTLPFFLFFFLFNVGYFLAANAPFDFQQSVTIVRNFKWFFREAFENFGLALLPVLAIFFPLILVAEWLPSIFKLGLPKRLYYVPISTVILTVLGVQYSDGVFDRYPSFFRAPSVFLFAGLSHVYDGERLPVTYSGPIEPEVEKIVLIVDESIRADILGINGYRQATTPYLGTVDSGIVNFGLAASSSNCSDYSNLILRTGVRKESIPDHDQLTLKTSTIWQYAKKAGFHTVYIDAQSPKGASGYQNFMNQGEARFIDELIRIRQEVAYQSDREALEKLMDYLKRPGKTFVMLNKYGMHFPYFRSYPDEYEFFTPALGPGEPMDDRQKSLNSFINGIRWTVDDWFKSLLAESGKFEPYAIVYTSDHGQNIVDDGTLSTHCRPQATRFEGMVPMIVLSNDETILERFETIQQASYNSTSHFQVFPTLLRLTGYPEEWVKRHYGTSLSELPDFQPRFFVGDLHGRGSIRQWDSIFPTETESD